MGEEKSGMFDFSMRGEWNVIVCYKGPFTRDILNTLGSAIRKINGRRDARGEKLFRVFIELSQNISRYSAEKEGGRESPGMGSLILMDDADHYRFVTENLVSNKKIAKVIERCREINSTDKDHLRELKRKHLANAVPDREGSDIGLIQLAITSGNPVEIKTRTVDSNKSFITITVRLNK